MYRKWQAPTQTTPKALKVERETLHVMDGVQRIALVETKTVDTNIPAYTPTTVTRLQLGNHLGSAAVEVDLAGMVISYEEYHPYGTTAYQAASGAVEVSRKRYRYTGKERDEETGLYYHGARYYACWLGRWTAADPAGLVDGPGLYTYVSNSPIRLRDPNGTDEEDPDQIALRTLQQMIAVNSASLGFTPPSAEAVAAQRAEAAALSKEQMARKAAASIPRASYSPSKESLPRVQPVYHVETRGWTISEAFFGPGNCLCLPQRLANLVANAPAEGVAAGEHCVKSVIHALRGETGEAVLSGLEALKSEADAATGLLTLATIALPGAEVAATESPAFGKLPQGAKIIRSGPDFVAFEVNGVARIRFSAARSRQIAEVSAAPNNTDRTMASVSDDGVVYVFEGCHRARDAARGASIPQRLGGVPDAPGVLEYNYTVDMVGENSAQWGGELSGDVKTLKGN